MRRRIKRKYNSTNVLGRRSRNEFVLPKEVVKVLKRYRGIKFTPRMFRFLEEFERYQSSSIQSALRMHVDAGRLRDEKIREGRRCYKVYWWEASCREIPQ